ncbi:T9SS type A sorting domain-containing protein [bacterium]|nr:T9SS type A sorting domain-containing protein [bacterium]
MRRKSWIVKLNLVIMGLLFMSFLTAAEAFTYLRIMQGGSEVETVVQGTPFSFILDCEPLDTVFLEFIPDYNENGIIDLGENPIRIGAMPIVDNGEYEPDGPPYFDSDPTAGILNIMNFGYTEEGMWFVRFSNRTDEISASFTMVAPPTITGTVSGRLVLEGMTPPDTLLQNIPIVGMNFAVPIFMLAITDNEGNFNFNWPVDPDTAMIFLALEEDVLRYYMGIGYNLSEGFDISIYIDGDITGLEINIPHSTSGTTFLDFMVMGTPVDTIIQGQRYAIKLDCFPFDTLNFSMIPDLNHNGRIDPGEENLLPFGTTIADNAEPSPYGPPFYDNDTTEGMILIPMMIHFWEGDWICEMYNDSAYIAEPFTIIAPSPLPASLSGNLIFEGLSTPDPWIDRIIIGAFAEDFSVGMLFSPDEYGEYSVNWPGEPCNLSFQPIVSSDINMHFDSMGYEINFIDTSVYIDGHITDFDIIFRAGGISYLDLYVEGVESDIQVQGQEYYFEMDCREWATLFFEIYWDQNSNGILEAGEPNFLHSTWLVNDNMWGFELFDFDSTPGLIKIDIPFQLPPNHYIALANEGLLSQTCPFIVQAPDPVTMSISGTVILEGLTPPDSLLEKIIVQAANSAVSVTYITYCDQYGEYTINWASGSDNVTLSIREPYPSYDYTFSSALNTIYVTSIETGVDLFVPSLIYGDSILINFETDSGLWEIPQGNIQAVFVTPEMDTVNFLPFPDSGDIYIPVKPYRCGVFFEGDNPYFAEHQFLSPYHILWTTPDSFPEVFDLYVDQTNYHFLLYFDDFALDSVPPEGIRVELFGTDSMGHEYYTDFNVFIGFYDSTYLVASERELCDGWWTLIIPDTLPGNFIPAFTETTFYIPEVFDWPWFAVHCPVSFTAIEESKVPDKIDLKVYPNPFNGTVAVDFSIGTPGKIKVEIFNIAGEKITTLLDNSIKEGKYRATWQCDTNRGEPVPTGIYLFKITTPTETKIMKGLYLR